MLSLPEVGSPTLGVAVNKAHVAPQDPVEYAFEEICNQFNLFLRRSNNREGQSECRVSAASLLWMRAIMNNRCKRWRGISV